MQHTRCAVSRLLVLGLLLFSMSGLSLSGCATKEKPQTPEDYLRLGDQALGQKREGQARKYYEQLLEQYPDSDLKAQANLRLPMPCIARRTILRRASNTRNFLSCIP